MRPLFSSGLFTSFPNGPRGLRGVVDIAVQCCLKLGRGQVGELVDALLPAAAAQVVTPDLLQVLGEDSEAVRPLLCRLVDLYEKDICSNSKSL